MSKRWFIVLIAVLAIMTGFAGRSMVDLHSVQGQKAHLNEMVNSLFAERDVWQQDASGLEIKVGQLEAQLADSEAATKVAQDKVVSFKKKIERVQRRDEITGLRSEFSLVKGGQSWELWDDDFSHFLTWFVQGQPSTWGNLGDCCFPILYEKAKAGTPGAAERYNLLAQYVKMSKPLIPWRDKASAQALKEIELILY